MLKVLAAVLAVLSAVISITLYSTTIPAVQKQAADNAEAIQTLGGSVSDNAEAIETLQGTVSDNAEAIETLEDKKIYRHDIYITKSNQYLCLITFINNSSTAINTKSAIISALPNNTAPAKIISATGWVYVSGDEHNYVIFGVFIAQGTNIRMRYRTMINGSTIEGNQTVDNDATIVDTITEL